MSSSIVTFHWAGLPHEIKSAVLDNLDTSDVWACSRSDRDSYAACLPILFKTVTLPSLDALLAFLAAVPSHHYIFIRDLFVCTRSALDDLHQYDAFSRPASPEATAPLAALLSHCTALDSLSIAVCGSLAPDVILPIFRKLDRVRKLKLENMEQEEISPLSERLAVSLAFSLPWLEDLSLTRITRSAMHAPELHCSNVPIVQGDGAIPPHARLGAELRLPQLFRLPHLRRLRIRDTHLGDPLWADPALGAASCPLELLDLGSCAHVAPSANEAHTARILARAPSTITACALSASLPAPSPTKDAAPHGASPSASPYSSQEDETCPPLASLPHLRTLHLTPLVPTGALASTLAQPTLSSSPVHTLSCAFHPDDAAEGCAALEAFLRERAGRAGRKRACSKLSHCAAPEHLAADAVDAEETRLKSTGPRARANTALVPAPVPTTSAVPPTPPARLYPALRTLSIDIPVDDALSPQPKLSPRRLAAARRRAEERRGAALRLRALAQELGLDIIVRGIDAEDATASFGAPSAQTAGAPGKATGLVRGRANTAF